MSPRVYFVSLGVAALLSFSLFVWAMDAELRYEAHAYHAEPEFPALPMTAPMPNSCLQGKII